MPIVLSLQKFLHHYHTDADADGHSMTRGVEHVNTDEHRARDNVRVVCDHPIFFYSNKQCARACITVRWARTFVQFNFTNLMYRIYGEAGLSHAGENDQMCR